MNYIIIIRKDVNYARRILPVVSWHCHGVKCQIKTLTTAEAILKAALTVEEEGRE